jgi:hypothetical protein
MRPHQITPNQLKEESVLLSKIIEGEALADLVAAAPRDGSTGLRKVSRREKVKMWTLTASFSLI